MLFCMNMEQEAQKKSWKQKLIEKSHSKNGLRTLYALSFFESAFFPIPPDVLMIPMIAARPESWKKIAFWVTVFSVLGALLGYLIGAVFFDTVGTWIVDTYSLHEEIQTVGTFFEKTAFWSILIAAFTPIPYKVFTVASGFFGVNLFVLIVASIIGRGARFYLVSYLSHIGGKHAVWEYLKKLKRGTLIGFCLLVLFCIYWFLIR